MTTQSEYHAGLLAILIVAASLQRLADRLGTGDD
jgi:hypothetical protein